MPASAAQLRLARPLIVAFSLGLLSSAGPRVLKVLFLLGRQRLGAEDAWQQVKRILRQALLWHRFPTFCAVLLGGSTLLQTPIALIIHKVLYVAKSRPNSKDTRLAAICAKFIAALSAASLSFQLLNSEPPKSSTVDSSETSPESFNSRDDTDRGPLIDTSTTPTQLANEAGTSVGPYYHIPLAGRTMDLTLFSAIRALDIILSSTWDYSSLSHSTKSRRAKRNIPTLLFSFSAATIMWSWFYSPDRLPRAYNTWISAAAQLDHRLMLVLRHARYGTWVYGKDTGMGMLLGSMCQDLGLPKDLGDPAKTCPVPCEIVHMGQGKSCEKHALWRFWKGWVFAAKMYAPLQAVVLVKHIHQNARPTGRFAGLTRDAVLRSTLDAARSSAFLGAFISMFYYGVCLSRTRLGPKLFSRETVTPQMWDSGLCVLGGCLLCGNSILIEHARKRIEILLFVLPRAAAVWFPRRYLPEHQWKEHLTFALSAAVVLTAAQESPKRVRGVFGGILHSVLKGDKT